MVFRGCLYEKCSYSPFLDWFQRTQHLSGQVSCAHCGVAGWVLKPSVHAQCAFPCPVLASRFLFIVSSFYILCRQWNSPYMELYTSFIGRVCVSMLITRGGISICSITVLAIVTALLLCGPSEIVSPPFDYFSLGPRLFRNLLPSSSPFHPSSIFPGEKKKKIKTLLMSPPTPRF